MKKFLLVVFFCIFILSFSACDSSVNGETSSLVGISKNIQSSNSEISSSNHVSSEISSHACYDYDDDGYCDVCGSKYIYCPAHQDLFSDGYCDMCNRLLQHSCYSQDGTYSDNNFDRLCDVCGSDLAHYCNDANGDGQCDKCFASFGISHRDTTGDGYCDIHKKCTTYVLEHNHIDKNKNHQCDLCYLPF